MSSCTIILSTALPSHHHPLLLHTYIQQDWGELLSLFRALQRDHYHPTAPMCHAALKAALALNDVDTAVAALKILIREGWNFGR